MPSVEEVTTDLILMDGEGLDSMGTEKVSMCLEHATEEKQARGG